MTHQHVPEPLSVAVLGCAGRMGQMLLRVVGETAGVRLSGASERPGSPWIGRDLGDGVIVRDAAAAALEGADAALDFTTPDATILHADAASSRGVAHVIGGTGFTEAHLAALAAASARCAQIRAGNMSLGVNLLTALTRKVAAALDDAFDIEIVEIHHNQKVDAPSGTALMFGEAAAAGRGVALADMSERGRDGQTGVRGRGAIGFAALRGGDVVGEHDVVFAGPGERVVLRHVATDRAIFARGAVKAAFWSRGKPPGAYTMMDVLGLSG